jgi:hypothetical protein
MKLFDKIIKFIKKYSVHFAFLIPFSMLMLNLSKSSLNIFSVLHSFLDLIVKLVQVSTTLGLFNGLIFAFVVYYGFKILKSHKRIGKKKKK